MPRAFGAIVERQQRWRRGKYEEAARVRWECERVTQGQEGKEIATEGLLKNRDGIFTPYAFREREY
jgi:hypothetical protein